MASTTNVLFAALAAALFVTCLGLPIARWVLPGPVSAGSLAPALGWAVFNALALPIFDATGFTTISTATLCGLAVVAGLGFLALLNRAGVGGGSASVRLPAWAFALAGSLASIPVIAILPKGADGGVILSTPIFDHSKIAIIDEMTRLGLPVGNPFFGEAGGRSVLAYYYLWHFSAAELALLTGITGWEADAAMTGVTAYSSLLLMMGLAASLGDETRFPGGRPTVALWVGLFSLTGSLRPVLSATLGGNMSDRLLSSYPGLAGWITQASWVPQHLASACSVVLAVLLLIQLADHFRPTVVLVLAAVAAAGFASSAWVGGVTFAAIALASAVFLLISAPRSQRAPFIAGATLAAVLAAAIVFPFLRDELGMSAARSGGAPVAFHPYEVLGPVVPESIRRALDLPAFWLLLLLIELPAIYPAGAVALLHFFTKSAGNPGRTRYAVVLTMQTLCSLTVAWLFVSTIGNNDLGWRAVLPAILVLTAFAAAGLASWIEARAGAAVIAIFLLVALSFPDRVINDDATGRPTPLAREFAGSQGLWTAVRRYAAPADRVGNNPLYLSGLTPWPANISWALLSNRPSCFAGWETVRAFSALPRPRVAAIDAQYIRIFDGRASPGDIRDLAQQYGCRVIVLVPSDGAWTHDPFASSPYFYQVEDERDRWRIYISSSAERTIAR